ncbi:MAG: ThuA domain-containing protein [Candidatus Hydrogenedentes bacterium]|nr:ThuA domain-containing protein [Candidatus Hydrogenedentota bacterium]
MNSSSPTARIVTAFVGLLTVAGVCGAAEPPPPRSRAEVEAVLAKAPRADAEEPGPLNVVLLADAKDHNNDAYAHDYPLWQKRWELLFGGAACSAEKQANLFGPARGDEEALRGAPNVRVTTAWHWPTAQQFADADVILAFCYLDWNDERFAQMRDYLERGGGLVVVHPASWTRKKDYAPRAAELLGIGGYREFRHGPVDVKIVKPQHPLCVGLPEVIRLDDETYWPPAPMADGVEVLATSDEIIDDEGHTAPQPVFWTYTVGEGRVAGCQPGHFTWTFDDPYFRIMVLRGAAWAAGESPYRFDALVLRDARVAD